MATCDVVLTSARAASTSIEATVKKYEDITAAATAAMHKSIAESEAAAKLMLNDVRRMVDVLGLDPVDEMELRVLEPVFYSFNWPLIGAALTGIIAIRDETMLMPIAESFADLDRAEFRMIGSVMMAATVGRQCVRTSDMSDAARIFVSARAAAAAEPEAASACESEPPSGTPPCAAVRFRGGGWSAAHTGGRGRISGRGGRGANGVCPAEPVCVASVPEALRAQDAGRGSAQRRAAARADKLRTEEEAAQARAAELATLEELEQEARAAAETALEERDRLTLRLQQEQAARVEADRVAERRRREQVAASQAREIATLRIIGLREAAVTTHRRVTEQRRLHLIVSRWRAASVATGRRQLAVAAARARTEGRLEAAREHAAVAERRMVSVEAEVQTQLSFLAGGTVGSSDRAAQTRVTFTDTRAVGLQARPVTMAIAATETAEAQTMAAGTQTDHRGGYDSDSDSVESVCSVVMEDNSEQQSSESDAPDPEWLAEAAAVLDAHQHSIGALVLRGAQRALDASADMQQTSVLTPAPSGVWLFAPLVPRRSGGRQRRSMRVARHGPLHVIMEGRLHRPTFVGGPQAQRAFLEAASAYGIDVVVDTQERQASA